MSLMSYCTDADDCDLIHPSKSNSSQENDTMTSKESQDNIKETKRTNKKSKANCSNIRKKLFINLYFNFMLLSLLYQY